jgi:hypothetical protein
MNMNTANQTNHQAPAVTLFVEYKDGSKVRYESMMRKPKVESSPYDFCLKLKAGLFDEVTSVHLNIEGVAKWWPVTLMRTSATYVTLTYCGDHRILLDTTDHLVPHNPRRVVGYQHVAILDKDGNIAMDKYGPKVIIRAIYGTGHTVKTVSIDHIHPQVKRLVEYK